MSNEEAIKNAILTAEEMIDGKIELITGCRILRNISMEANLYNDELFLPFIAVDSETDHFPLGKRRDLCDPDYLKRMDIEMTEYLELETPYILAACKKNIEYLKNKSGK